MKLSLFVYTAVLATWMSACGTDPRSDFAGRNVFGEDQRRALTSREWPWRTIGRLTGNGSCTATLVAADLVLTAAHCVLEDGKLTGQPIRYYPHMVDGQSLWESGVNHVWWGTTDPVTRTREDWAVLRLTEPLGERYGWLATGSVGVQDFPAGLSLAGYSYDFAGGATAGLHEGCRTRARLPEKGLILHDCDATRGASGGPALAMIDDQLTIVGMNVAERRDGGEHSLHAESWSDAQANVIIPSAGFVRRLRLILGLD